MVPSRLYYERNAVCWLASLFFPTLPGGRHRRSNICLKHNGGRGWDHPPSVGPCCADRVNSRHCAVRTAFVWVIGNTQVGHIIASASMTLEICPQTSTSLKSALGPKLRTSVIIHVTSAGLWCGGGRVLCLRASNAYLWVNVLDSVEPKIIAIHSSCGFLGISALKAGLSPMRLSSYSLMSDYVL